MDNEKESVEKYRAIISELRRKWIHSLFRKKYGFEPSVTIDLDGNVENSFETLKQIHQFKRVKWALLNNQFVNTSKRILFHNRFANLFMGK
jgi:hypothetical protein